MRELERDVLCNAITLAIRSAECAEAAARAVDASDATARRLREQADFYRRTTRRLTRLLVRKMSEAAAM